MKSEEVSNLPTRCGTKHEKRAEDDLEMKSGTMKVLGSLRCSESRGKLRRESHSSLRQGQPINIPKRKDTCSLSLI